MALADLTKQIAQQALLSATAPSKEPPAASADALGGVILGQIAASGRAHRPRCAPVAYARGGGGRVATTCVQDGQDCARRETRPGRSDYGETERFQRVITRVSRS
jgi:hypothetical protein